MARFGAFEVDLRSGELRKQGLRLRLQEQPFQVLAALLEQPGELVTREELVRRLWPDGTTVDFDRSLNAAVTRLRQALSDSADVPRYIETIARRGYRFIAPLQAPREEPVGPPAAPAPTASITAAPPARRPQSAGLAIALSVTAIAVAAGWLVHPRPAPSDAPLQVVRLTAGSGMERCASFSPDGAQAVYEWEQIDGAHHLFKKVVGEGDRTPLTSGPAEEFGPAWSPDGRLVAFIRSLSASTIGVFTIPPFGGVERKIAEFPTPGYWTLRRFLRRLDWTPDSRHLILSIPAHPRAAEDLLLLSIETGSRTWLTESSASTDPSDGDREPTVSPDGRTVAFTRDRSSVGQGIFLLSLSADLRPTGAPRHFLTSAQGPAWTPDSRHIVYTPSHPGMTFDSGLSLAPIDGRGAPRSLLALGSNAVLPAVARSGRIAYSRIAMESTIWRQQIPSHSAAAAAPVRLASSSAAEGNAQYSPDGSRIVFASNRSGYREIWTCAADGARCAQITSFNAPSISGSPRWSPDGGRIAFDFTSAGRTAIYVVDAAGGPPRRVTDDSTHGVVPGWSHDGKWIYFSSGVTGRNEIWKIPSAGGAAVQITRNGGFIASESADGAALYYIKDETNSTLFTSRIDGSAETALLSGVTHRGFAIGAGAIYYVRQEHDGEASIRRFVPATRQDSPIASAANPFYIGLGLSPDGRYLLYSTLRVSSNLMLVDSFR
jgi:Tol biopolymer transport system component/DNA-binding winged helix-turn-helix (wHTH) protein